MDLIFFTVVNLNKTKDLLGAEDPIYQKIRTIMNGFGNALISIESFIEKGKIIEDFHPDALKEIFMRSEGQNIE